MSSGAAADPASTDASFAQHYKIRDEVGRGAFGTVFFATRSAVDESATASAATVREEQSDSGEVVAVKRFELAELTSSERSDAIAEAALLRSLSHENIIEYIDLFVGVSRIHLVTSYVGGGTVFDQLSHADGNDTGAPIKPYSEAEACGALRRVLDALCYLHDGSSGNYVLYRDLKPENLLLVPARTADGLADRTRVVLCDFGFAIRLRASVPGVGGKAVRELATEACYTPGYGAPEVVGGRPYGTAADIFSFGVLAFVLLTGGLPYDEDLWDNTNKLDEATAAGRLVFDHSPEWRAASDEAKDFVQAAVAYSAHKRPHAVGLLRHKWLHGSDMGDGTTTSVGGAGAARPQKPPKVPTDRKARAQKRAAPPAARGGKGKAATEGGGLMRAPRRLAHAMRKAGVMSSHESAPLLSPPGASNSN